MSDLDFTLDLISSLSTTLCVDHTRIFASGKSEGGGFVGALACDAKTSALIAAFAPVSGAFYETDQGVPLAGPCRPRRTPIPMMEFHGSADRVIAYEGAPRSGDQVPPIPQWLHHWAYLDGCTTDDQGQQDFMFNGIVNQTTWSCAQYKDIVTGYWIEGLGHVWPSTTPNDDDKHGHTVLNATPIIMDFFSRYSL